VKGTSETRLAGLAAVRIAWITAILVCGLAILVELFSGTSGGSASQQMPGFAFSAGRDSSQRLPEFSSTASAAAMEGAAAQEDHSGRAKQKPPGGSHSGSGIPPRSGNQLVDTGGRTPVATPRPKPPGALEGDPAKAPQASPVTLPNPAEPPKPPKPPKEPSTPPGLPKPPKPPEEPSVDPPKPPEEPSPEPPEPPEP
jgi:hypothetical protein